MSQSAPERVAEIVTNIKPYDNKPFHAEELTAALNLSLENPRFVSAREARHMRDDDQVVGLQLQGEARCYPCWIWDYHHVINDVWNGTQIAIAG